MKTLSNYIILVLSIVLISCAHKSPDQMNITGHMNQTRLPEWFTEGKFDMFIHWGPYSVLGGEWKGKRIEQGDIAEWIMHRFKIPVEEYRKIAATFNPTILPTIF